MLQPGQANALSQLVQLGNGQVTDLILDFRKAHVRVVESGAYISSSFLTSSQGNSGLSPFSAIASSRSRRSSKSSSRSWRRATVWLRDSIFSRMAASLISFLAVFNCIHLDRVLRELCIQFGHVTVEITPQSFH